MELRADLMDTHLYAIRRFDLFFLKLIAFTKFEIISVLISYLFPLKICLARSSFSEGELPKLKRGCPALSRLEPAGMFGISVGIYYHVCCLEFYRYPWLRHLFDFNRDQTYWQVVHHKQRRVVTRLAPKINQ